MYCTVWYQGMLLVFECMGWTGTDETVGFDQPQDCSVRRLPATKK